MEPETTHAVNLSKRSRDPEATRSRLLQCGFDEIYEQGYAGASLDRILANSGVTKGALYHHFGSKADLAIAIIDEVVRPHILERWVSPLLHTDDPIGAFMESAHAAMIECDERRLTCGCPLNNLAQELSSTDERFRAHIDGAFNLWRAGLADAFERGQRAGTIRSDVDPKGIAAFLVAGIGGMATQMKSSRSLDVARSASTVFFQVLESLRTTPDKVEE